MRSAAFVGYDKRPRAIQHPEHARYLSSDLWNKRVEPCILPLLLMLPRVNNVPMFSSSSSSFFRKFYEWSRGG